MTSALPWTVHWPGCAVETEGMPWRIVVVCRSVPTQEQIGARSTRPPLRRQDEAGLTGTTGIAAHL